MDLQADKKVTISPRWEDEMRNPVEAPDGATVTYSVDDDSIIALTDNGDGTAVAASTGVLGEGIVHAEATVPGRAPATGDLLIVVVPGDAERFTLEAGPAEEVTPDEGPPTP